MLLPLILAAALASPSMGTAGDPREKAQAYFADGLRAFEAERYEDAIKKFEMSSLMAKHAFGEDAMLGDALRYATASALRAGAGPKAVDLATKYADWSRKPGGVDAARAHNDLVEANLLAGRQEAAERALGRAEVTARVANDEEQSTRFAALARRTSPDQPAVSRRSVRPAGAARADATEATASADDSTASAPAIVQRKVRRVEWTAESDSGSDDAGDDTGDDTDAVADQQQDLATEEPPVAAAEPAAAKAPTSKPAKASKPPARQAKASKPAAKPAKPPKPATSEAPAKTAKLTPPPSPVKPPAATPRTTATSSAGMVLIPATQFEMGSIDGDSDERPLRTVSLQTFRIDTHEVTNAEFAEFVKATGYIAKGDWKRTFGTGDERHPVRSVTHDDAAAYASHAGKRLPTEAEWELAARGPDGWRYSFGTEFSAGSGRVGFSEKAGPVAVGSFAANGWGLYDMSGNVMEWVGDWYDADAYKTAFEAAPSGPPGGARQIARGGAWDADKKAARCTDRAGVPTSRASTKIGFRCVQDVP